MDKLLVTLGLFLENFLDIFVDMAFYLMLGLFFVGLLNTFVKRDKVLKHLGSPKFSSVVKASMVGVPLPLCSCGVVPTAIQLKRSGASNGAVISFLISTPQTGVDSIAATYSIMGGLMAVFRPIAAFCSGILGGAVVNLLAKNETMNLEQYAGACSCETPASSCCSETPASSCCSETPASSCACETPASSCCSETPASSCCSETPASSCACETPASSCACETPASSCCSETPASSCACETPASSCCSETPASSCCSETSSLPAGKENKLFRAIRYAYCDFLDDISTHFLVGIFLASLISTFLPADFFINMGMNQGFLSMISMVLVGVPMYICSTSSIPIALSLISKGISLGSAFVFLFTGPVTNIASILVLSKVLGKENYRTLPQFGGHLLYFFRFHLRCHSSRLPH